jgi:hypothetical protein
MNLHVHLLVNYATDLSDLETNSEMHINITSYCVPATFIFDWSTSITRFLFPSLLPNKD